MIQGISLSSVRLLSVALFKATLDELFPLSIPVIWSQQEAQRLSSQSPPQPTAACGRVSTPAERTPSSHKRDGGQGCQTQEAMKAFSC